MPVVCSKDFSYWAIKLEGTALLSSYRTKKYCLERLYKVDSKGAVHSTYGFNVDTGHIVASCGKDGKKKHLSLSGLLSQTFWDKKTPYHVYI